MHNETGTGEPSNRERAATAIAAALKITAAEVLGDSTLRAWRAHGAVAASFRGADYHFPDATPPRAPASNAPASPKPPAVAAPKPATATAAGTGESRPTMTATAATLCTFDGARVDLRVPGNVLLLDFVLLRRCVLAAAEKFGLTVDQVAADRTGQASRSKDGWTYRFRDQNFTSKLDSLDPSVAPALRAFAALATREATLTATASAAAPPLNAPAKPKPGTLAEREAREKMREKARHLGDVATGAVPPPKEAGAPALASALPKFKPDPAKAAAVREKVERLLKTGR